MTTDKQVAALREAAETVSKWLASGQLSLWTYIEGGRFYDDVHSHRCLLDEAIEALAAHQPAPEPAVTDAEIETATDEVREAKIEAIDRALRWTGHADECREHRDGPETCDCGSRDAVKKARAALALMRSAPPAPSPDQALRELRDFIIYEADVEPAEGGGYSFTEGRADPATILVEIDRMLSAMQPTKNP